MLVHIPDKDHATTRYCGWYANRPRGMRRRAEPVPADARVPIVTAPRLAPADATRRWAALLQQVLEVDPLTCLRCQGSMRILAFITQASVIDQIWDSASGRRSAAGPAAGPSPNHLRLTVRARHS